MLSDLHNKLVIHITVQVGGVDNWGLNSTELIKDPVEVVFNIKLQLCRREERICGCAPGGFFGPGLRVARITCSLTPLARPAKEDEKCRLPEDPGKRRKSLVNSYSLLQLPILIV